jgi:hypothetical protein
MRLPGMRLRSSKPAVSRDLSRALRPLMKELTSPDEARRRACIEHLDREAIPPVRELVVDLLVALLKGKRSEDTRRRAAEALVGLGESASAALRLHLLSTRASRVQLPLIEILTRIGQSLPPYRRVRLQFDLEIALATAASEDVATAILVAQERLRPGTPSETDNARGTSDWPYRGNP